MDVHRMMLGHTASLEAETLELTERKEGWVMKEVRRCWSESTKLMYIVMTIVSNIYLNFRKILSTLIIYCIYI